MQQHTINSMGELATRIRENPENGLNTLILEVLSEHDNSWVDQTDLPRLLNMYILPSVAEARKKKFRIWVAGCGRGQLPYTVAMQISEYTQSHNLNTEFEIIATDISASDIEHANSAYYEAAMLDGLTPALQKKYMKADADGWTVNPAIRNMVEFSTHDLLSPLATMGHFDLIVCADVLIYFSAQVRMQVLDAFARLLDPSGILVVGSSEAVMPFSKSYTRVAHEAGVFYRQLPY